MTISVCIIVKNEEFRIEEFLLSIKDFADEIVIVDTGCSDKTIDVIKDVGRREKMNVVIDQYIRPGTFHFGKARNYSLKKATMDYVVVLDVDEMVGVEFKKGIRDFLERKKPLVARFNLIDEVVPHRVNRPPRIIKNRQNIFYGEEERDSIHTRLFHNHQVDDCPMPVFHCPRETGTFYAPQKMLTRVLMKVNEEERSDRPFAIYFLRAIRNFWRKFYKLYFKGQLYKDGGRGFKFAFWHGFHLFLTVFLVGLKPKKNYKYWEDPKWKPPRGMK